MTIAKWTYYNLINGRLLDAHNQDANKKWPSFESVEAAEKWLEDNDECGSVLS